jgi:hypothetical protein
MHRNSQHPPYGRPTPSWAVFGVPQKDVQVRRRTAQTSAGVLFVSCESPNNPIGMLLVRTFELGSVGWNG